MFYYMAVGRNPVNSVGYDTRQNRDGLFTCAARAWESAGQPPEMLAYLLGVVCHFTLDAACHGYVERKIQASGEATKIETEFTTGTDGCQQPWTHCATASPGTFSPAISARPPVPRSIPR